MAVVARATVTALLAAGIDVAVLDVDEDSRGRGRDWKHASRTVDGPSELPYDVNLHVDSPFLLRRLMQEDGRIFEGRRNALLPFWELTRLPLAWEPVIRRMDTVFAASTFIAHAVRTSVGSAVRPVPVTPLLPEGTLQRASVLDRGRAFRFFTSFDMLSSPERKNPTAALSAFVHAFRGRDDVQLIVKIWGGSEPGVDRAELDRIMLEHRNIRFIFDDFSYEDVLTIYRDCDAYLTLHRAEGLGLGMLEAMSFGRPVVATDYSGNTDFLDETTGEPVGYRLVPVRAPEPVYSAASVGCETTWAEPDVAAAALAMQRLVADPGRTARLGAAARERVEDRRRAFLGGAWIEPFLGRTSFVSAPAAQPVAELTFGEARTREPVRVLLEGQFLQPYSLAHVNRELGARLVREDGMGFYGASYGGTDPAIRLDPALSERMLPLESVAQAEPLVRIWHLWPPQWDRRPSGHYIVCQPWEFGELPIAWRDAIARGVDRVWAYSAYVRDIYLRAGVPEQKIGLVPLGVDTSILRPDGPRLELPARSFRFLYVGGTIGRKGADVLVNTYLKTFAPGDDVTLVIKDTGSNTVYKGQNLRDQLLALQGRDDVPHVLYVDATMDDAQMAALYRSCDVLVAPYRGEGFGMPILEAMACGKPVIVTRGGAADDFADDAVGITISATRTSVGSRIGDLELVREGWVLEPDEGELAFALRRAYRDAAGLASLGAAAARRASEWTWDRSARFAADDIRRLIAAGAAR